MKAADLCGWWVCFVWFCLASRGPIDWKSLNKGLNEHENNLTIKTIVESWEERPQDLFRGISEQSWGAIIPQLSDSEIGGIRPEEFGYSIAACKAFAEHLAKLSNTRALPNAFREAVASLIPRENEGSHESKSIIKIIEAIPPIWMETHGKLFMRALTLPKPSKLRYLNKKALDFLLKNMDNSCELITIDTLLELEKEDLTLLSPECIGAIKGLETVDLSEIVEHLGKDAFAYYNGALSKQTIQKLSENQIRGYGSLLAWQEICKSLELHHLNPAAAEGITPKCLAGYLSSQQQTIGLGKLWEVIPSYIVGVFTDDMVPSLANIPLDDYDSMSTENQSDILYWKKTCPTTNLAFWTTKRIKHISSKCLLEIFSTAKAPVELGVLWNAIRKDSVQEFSDGIKSSWLNIYQGDLYLMKPNILKIIASSPGICSALGSQFWNTERIKHISSECLHTMLKSTTDEGDSVTLGKLWKKVDEEVVKGFTDEMKLSWLNIAHADFYLMQPKVLKIVSSGPGVCSALGLSFWDEDNIRFMSKECLNDILVSSTTLVKFGWLWNKMDYWMLEESTDEIKSSWLKIDRSDYEYIEPAIFEILLSGPGVFSALEPSFWTKERIKGISSKCLYNILAGSKDPIKLGNIWKWISRSVVGDFTEGMKSVWSNIDRSDFDLMDLGVLQVISTNPKACSSLGLEFWTNEKIKYISSECLHTVLLGLEAPVKLGELWEQIDSSVLYGFRYEMEESWLRIDHGDFHFMKPEVSRAILRGPKVCPSLELSFWTEERIEHISSNCLYKVLMEAKPPVQLGNLWQNIGSQVIRDFHGEETAAWASIDHGDFSFMKPKVLKAILPSSKVCPTTELSFWTEKRIKYISSNCLHRILTETPGPVKLGKLWQRISWSAIHGFTDEMKVAWRNIDRDDFYSMNPDILKLISSDPTVCAILGLAFWSKERTSYISSSCLHTIIAGLPEPVKLGELWRKVNPHLLDFFAHQMRSVWQRIDASDFDFMDPRVLELILSEPTVCPSTNVSFWTKERIMHISSKCLYRILTENEAPVKLGELWRHMERTVINEFTQDMQGSWLNIERGDFYFMELVTIKTLSTVPKICSSLGLEFWTEENIKDISEDCLRTLLVESKAPVSLGSLWGKIEISMLKYAAKETKSSWIKVDRKDFDLMGPEVLKVMTSSPEVCSALGLKFWTKKTIKSLSKECLATIIKEYTAPVELGDLWKDIEQELVIHADDETRSSWVKIDRKDFAFMKPGTLKILASWPAVCSGLGLSFWTEQNIKGMSGSCLRTILKESERPVRLGKMWIDIGQELVRYADNQTKSLWVKIDQEDFPFMEPETLQIISSGPGVCSALDLAFWTRERMSYISPECLHELITKKKPSSRLGSFWEDIPLSLIYELVKKMGLRWDDIHIGDYDIVQRVIGSAVYENPKICAFLDADFWTIETIALVTEDCLYAILSREGGPVALGRLWKRIPSQIIGRFKLQKLHLFKNVSGGDFQYMPSDLLRSILLQNVSYNMPELFTGIVLSTTANKIPLNPGHFANLVKVAPSVAGQLLWHSAKLSKEVLSKCDGKDIRSLSLVVPGGEELDWRGLFARLEKKYSLAGEPKRFGQMIQHISQDTENHFCATLDLDEYRSLSWLHPNLSESCLSKLQFKPDEISELFSRPELAADSLSWRKMLREYSPSDWALLSQSKIINDLLGGDCEFWGTISGEGYNKVFDALDESIFRSIVPECVLKLTNILRQNAAMIQLLADDAFAKYRVDQLSCRLDSLSPAHISHLSSKLSMDSEQSGQQKASLKISLDEIKDLSFEQFKSLYESRWISIERDIKDTALSYQLERVQSQLLVAAKKLESNSFHQNSKEDFTEDQVNGFRTIENTLTAVLELYNNNRKIPERGLASILNAIKESDLWATFVKAFGRSPKLGPIILGLIRDADGLQRCILATLDSSIIQSASLPISHDGRFGFDRSGIIDIFEKMPELFAAPNALVRNQSIMDTGGAIRSLASQLLGDIERDLVVPYVRTMDHDGRADGVGAGNSKFAWGVSKQAGLAVGLALGKALQLGIRMPFALNLGLYELLIDPSDETIESYYMATYNQEVFKYRQSILGLYNAGNIGALLDIIPKLDSLRFTGLSTKAGAEEAKQDIKTRTNLWGCSDEDCYADIKELEGKEFIENYITIVLERIQEEFKEFVRELFRGLEMALPLVKRFNSLPVPLPVLRPFAEFLPGLLNAEAVSGENVLARIKFEGDNQVPSLVQAQTISAKEVFSAFLLSLEAEQLEHLIGLWTGSSTLLLKCSELRVTFMPPGDMASYQVNFCEAGKGNYLIASGKEYKDLFSKFSEKLLGAGVTVGPDCESERAGIIIPVRPTTCTKNLTVYLQSAEQMLNSLVELLRTSLTTLWDNQ